MKFKVGDAGFLFASTLLVNAGNYLINLILGRFLGPEKFAEASVVATGVLMLSFLAVGVQLTSAKFSAEYYADKKEDDILLFQHWISKKVLIIGLSIGAILILLSKLLQSYLHFNSSIPFIIVGLGIPLYFNLSVKRGIAQGTDRFRQLAFTYILEMVLRLLVTFSLVFWALEQADYLTTEAVSLGFLASFFAAIWIRPKKVMASINNSVDTEAIKKFVFIILIYELSQILINNSDVILAKHFFNAKDAGLYAAIALIGRVVFFGTWTIVTLLFPKVIQREKQGLPHFSLFWISFGVVAAFGAMVIAGSYLVPELIINILFGAEYLVVSDLLWKYAVATSLFALANVFAYYYMSLNKYLPVFFSVIAGISQVCFIYMFHQSLEQMITVQIIIMSALLIVLVIYQLVQYYAPKKQILSNPQL